MEGVRLRAKGEKIVFDTVDGKKEYELRPIKNKQLLEVVEKADKKESMKAALLLAKYSINRDPRIVKGIIEIEQHGKITSIDGSAEKPFTDKEMEETDAPFLMQIMEKAAKINGMGDVFDFQMKGKEALPEQDSSKSPFEKNLEVLNKNPAKKI